MSSLLKISLLVFASLPLLLGCETTNSQRYTPSIKHVAFLSQQKGKVTYSLGTFGQDESIDEDTLCRLHGSVDVTNGKETYSEYIQSALMQELFMSGLYNKNSPRKIKVFLDSVEFSSISPANWVIEGRFQVSEYPVKKIKAVHRFDSSWTAWGACKNVANAFPSAVEKFIGKIISDETFK